MKVIKWQSAVKNDENSYACDYIDKNNRILRIICKIKQENIESFLAQDNQRMKVSFDSKRFMSSMNCVAKGFFGKSEGKIQD